MLRPDRTPEDYERFYDEIGAAQLEERYLANNSYAIARMRLVLDLLLPVARRGGKLLDIGCASGYYSVAFAKAGGRSTGIDISEASIALARRRAERESVADRCEFLQGDLRTLPLGEGDYDAATMIEVLEHVREQSVAVEHAVRALRPGGVLIVTTPHAFDDLPRRQRFRHRNAPTPEAASVHVQRLGTNELVTESGIDHEPYFHDAFTFEQIRRLLPAEAEIVRLHSLYVPLPGLRLLAHLPQPVKRMLRSRVPQPVTAEPKENDGAHAEPVSIGSPGLDGSLMVRLSKLMWRIPVARMTFNHHLLVARRREPAATDR